MYIRMFTKDEAVFLVTTTMQGARQAREAMGILTSNYQVILNEKLDLLIAAVEETRPCCNKATKGVPKHGCGTPGMWRFAATVEQVVKIVGEQPEYEPVRKLNTMINVPKDIGACLKPIEHYKFKVSHDKKTAYIEAAIKAGEMQSVWDFMLKGLASVDEINEEEE